MRRLSLAALTLSFFAIGSAAQVPDRSATLVVEGHVRTVDFAAVVGGEVRLRDTGVGTRIDGGGHFLLRSLPLGAAEDLLVVQLDGYFPAAIPVTGSANLGTLLLVPRTWHIATGAHAGEEVQVDLAGASGVDCSRCDAFFGRTLGQESSVLPPGIPTWRPSALPLQVAFDRANGARITQADSLAFWRVVRSMEDRFGLRLFRPAPLSEVLANVSNDGPGSLLVMVDPRLPSIGWGSSVAQSGEILAGAVHFRSAFTFRRAGAKEVVAHEVFHALGFGHTCAWRSIVADARRCRGRQSPLPTAEDVAHAQLLWRIRDLERAARVWNTIDAALLAAGHRRRSAAAVGLTHHDGTRNAIPRPPASLAP